MGWTQFLQKRKKAASYQHLKTKLQNFIHLCAVTEGLFRILQSCIMSIDMILKRRTMESVSGAPPAGPFSNSTLHLCVHIVEILEKRSFLVSFYG